MSDPLARLNAGQGASLRLYAAERDLTRAGKRLRAARADAAVALTEARNAALSAHAAGVSERTIASALDVNRTTVRRWLGKPRDYPRQAFLPGACKTCGYWAVDADDMREHLANNPPAHNHL